ncbi:hypothetical protein [uncultured Mucilaginibacter sp.]|uniref:hypothetical protein n=1 Tax=uncultured Mucilaginibacter sp. TaxID=797541 RepID=UPI0025D36E42|nr:hypothetical protein [uncultured Mucilaginibacter sp.]
MKTVFTLLFIAFSLAAIAQDAPETPQEKKAAELIAALPEVISFNKHMKEIHERPLVIAIDTDPTPADPYYTVAVEEDLGDHAFTYWRFCVGEKTQTIFYFDIIANKKIPLDVWRKNGRRP